MPTVYAYPFKHGKNPIVGEHWVRCYPKADERLIKMADEACWQEEWPESAVPRYSIERPSTAKQFKPVRGGTFFCFLTHTKPTQDFLILCASVSLLITFSYWLFAENVEIISGRYYFLLLFIPCDS